MAFPNDVTLREVTFGPAFDLTSGAPLAMKVTFTPSRSMVRGAPTGSPGVAREYSVTTEEGMEGSISIPVTDQAGWFDGNGNAISTDAGGNTHSYRVRVAYLNEQGREVGSPPAAKSIALPTGDGSPVDLDALIPVTTTGGVTVSVPDSWSADVAAAAASAAAAEAALSDADTLVAGNINDTGSATRASLNDTYGARAVPDFYTRNYPSIQAAVDAAGALSTGGNVHITENHTITTPITLHATRPVSLIGRRGVTVTAGAAMVAMIDKPSGYCEGIQLRNLDLDGAMLAERAVRVEQALRLSITGGIWKNVTTCVADFGPASGQVYEMDWRDTRVIGIDNSRSGATPAQMPDYGYRFGANVTDSVVENVVVKNADIGVLDGGNVNVHRTVHVFPFPYGAGGTDNYTGSCGFRITGSINRLDHCYADTQVLGFDLKGDRNTVTAAMFYWPVDFQHVGNIIGVRFDSVGNTVNGATTRFPTAGGGDTQLTGYFVEVMPARWLNVVTNCNLNGPWTAFQNVQATGTAPMSVANAWNQGTVPLNLGTIDTLTVATLTATGTTTLGTTNVGGALNATTGDMRVSGAAGANREFRYQTVSSPRFISRINNTAESGSDVGSRYQLIAYTDAGAFKYTVAEVDRRNGVLQLPQGSTQRVKAGTPTDADFGTLAPGDGTMVVDTSTSKLWIRIGGTWKSVTLA